MPWPQTGANQYHAQLGLPDNDRAIKELDVFNNWDLEPLDLLNGLTLGCYQASPEVLIILYTHFSMFNRLFFLYFDVGSLILDKIIFFCVCMNWCIFQRSTPEFRRAQYILRYVRYI